MPQTVRGRGSFIAGSIALILFAAIHFLAVIKANFGEPGTPEEAEVRRVLENLTATLGPFEPTAWGATQLLNASYSVLLMHVGVLSLLAMRPVIEHGRLRMLTLVNILFAGLLLLITVLYQFPPPMVLATLVLVLFVVSLIRQGGSARVRGS